jgi:hypothetical protein
MRVSSQQGWLVSTVRKLSRGPDLDSAVPAELVAFAGRLNNALRRLESDWAIFVEAQRHSAGGYRAAPGLAACPRSQRALRATSPRRTYGIPQRNLPRLRHACRETPLFYTGLTVAALKKADWVIPILHQNWHRKVLELAGRARYQWGRAGCQLGGNYV